MFVKACVALCKSNYSSIFPQEHKFVEARVQEPGTLCVVLRLKREEVEITRFGGKAVSSADSRVTLTWPPDVVNATADLTMGVCRTADCVPEG